MRTEFISMKRMFILFSVLFPTSYSNAQGIEEEKAVHELLDAWHKAAAAADFETYFGYMDDEAVFIGTDATENWQNEEFRTFAKPYFDKGKAWSFTALERNVYLDRTNAIAWFDELLDTQMKICRGSGILVRKNGKWKIKHYVLSVTVPNEYVEQLIKIKEREDNALMDKIRKGQ